MVLAVRPPPHLALQGEDKGGVKNHTTSSRAFGSCCRCLSSSEKGKNFP